MNAKRTKKNKLELNKILKAGNFPSKIKMIIDGNFAKICADIGFHYKRLENNLDCQIYFFTTHCVIKELLLFGEDFEYIVKYLKKIPEFNCGHKKHPLNASDCINSLIGFENSRRLAILTQDSEIHKKIESVFPLPIIYFKKGNILKVLKTPEKFYKQLTIDKQEEDGISKAQKEELAKIRQQLEDKRKKECRENLRKERSKLAIKKTKKAKGPNPLSLKKKKLN